MKIEALRICRGRIIEKFIGVEQLLAGLITWHYFEKQNLEFTLNILGNDQSNFGFKRNIFLLLFKSETPDFIPSLNKLNKIRNIFSHAPMMRKNDTSDDYYFRNIDSDQPVNTELDPEKLNLEFNEIFPKVIVGLNKIAEIKGWPMKLDTNVF